MHTMVYVDWQDKRDWKPFFQRPKTDSSDEQFTRIVKENRSGKYYKHTDYNL